MQTCITHINIYTEHEIIRNGSLLIENGIITEIHDLPDFHVRSKHAVTIDGNHLSAIPGYIDTHCHGGGGFDCNDRTCDSIAGMRDFYSNCGVTMLYPTLSANKLPALISGIEAIRDAMRHNQPGKTEIGGTHLEGPFLNKTYKGCQSEDAIIPFEEEHVQLYADNKDVIRRTTVAPEVAKNVACFPLLKELGIRISIGHSCATYREVVHAVEKGASGITHLYNAMSQTKKTGPFRVGGVLEAGLTLDELYAEIIADGNHVPDESMRIAYRCKGAGKLSVCSDANSAAGTTGNDVIHSCTGSFIIENGVAMNSERTSLASSITPLDRMVRHLIFKTGFPAFDVVKMASTTTAEMMGIAHRKGSIAVGKDADINLVDDQFKVIKTFFKGIPKRVVSER
ncbi:MAG: N-acetylglucosamine-6-phosphate deacetylase [Tannerella sp.]|jgi:N-acetylglucosamine-6-phosphate deacetylase|nr:N-acetylglucosamine-6-phosphate deacetylase [Tannerella sp.]